MTTGADLAALTAATGIPPHELAELERRGQLHLLRGVNRADPDGRAAIAAARMSLLHSAYQIAWVTGEDDVPLT
jgi:hypothetical protein